MIAREGLHIQGDRSRRDNDAFGFDKEIVLPDHFDLFWRFKLGGASVDCDVIGLNEAFKTGADVCNNAVFCALALLVPYLIYGLGTGALEGEAFARLLAYVTLPTAILLLARSGKSPGLWDVIAVLAIATYGRFCLVFQTTWDDRVLEGATRAGLHLRARADVTMRTDRSDPFLTVYEFGRTAAELDTQRFAVRDDSGQITAAYREVRRELGVG